MFIAILWVALLAWWRLKLRNEAGLTGYLGLIVVRPMVWGLPFLLIHPDPGIQALFSAWVGGGMLILVLRFVGWIDNRAQEGEGLADVREDAASMQRLAEGFDPLPFIQKARQGEVFVGLNDNRKPIYLQAKVFQKNHIEILGESGVGKSSLAGVLLSQFARAGETVVAFDPKADRNLPGVLARAGKKWGFPVTLIDLRFQAPPQLNPFLHARRDQVEELLQVALELGKTGDGGVDFYRGKDREATGWLAQAFEDGQTSMPELVREGAIDERVTEQENLWRELRTLARIPAFNIEQGQDGLDLPALLQSPGVVYVYGSTTRLEVQAAQKLLLQRALQVIDERADQSRPVALFLDELKYLLSPASLRAAGTIRDRNCHLLFAHQSLQDLADCPGLQKEAVKGAIWGNAGVKFVYKMLDASTAKELSLIAGQKSTWQVSYSENANGESTSGRLEKQALMPEHTFTHLPKPIDGEASVGVVFGLGPAFFVSTRWLESGPAPEVIPAAPLVKPEPAGPAASAPVPEPVSDAAQEPADMPDIDELFNAPDPAQQQASKPAAAQFLDEV